MNCIHCEIKRAKVRSLLWLSVGWSNERIAARLSEIYGERYYVKEESIFRASKLPPYKPILIL